VRPAARRKWRCRTLAASKPARPQTTATPRAPARHPGGSLSRRARLSSTRASRCSASTPASAPAATSQARRLGRGGLLPRRHA
jgi:hypothetical protein